MLKLAEYYKKDVKEVHRMFYEVSCDREKLIKTLECEKLIVGKWN